MPHLTKWERMRQKRLESEKTKKRNAELATFQRDRYRLRKEHGICVRCGKADAEEGRVMCWSCMLERNQLYGGALNWKDRH